MLTVEFIGLDDEGFYDRAVVVRDGVRIEISEATLDDVVAALKIRFINDCALLNRLEDRMSDLAAALGLHSSDEGFVFEFKDFSITDPTISECGRFDVDPVTYYGLTAEQAHALTVLNG